MSKTPSDQDLELKFDLEMANQIRMAMRLSQFRNAKTPVEKAKAPNESGELIPISVAYKAMSISTKIFYQKKDKDDTECKGPRFSSLSQLLSIEEEENVIKQILKAQLTFQCLSGQNVRNIASRLYKTRTCIERPFDRYWYRNFLLRNAENVGKKKCPSVDNDRGEFSIEFIEKYIDEVLSALKKITELRLLIIMDEIGFCRSPHYGKRRICVYVKKCLVELVWRQETDSYRISWFAV